MRMELNLKDKGSLVESLWHAVDGAAGSLANVPGLVRRVIETGAWHERTQRGKTVSNSSFLEFITAKPLRGCGWPPQKVEALLKDDAEVLALWHDATTARKGRPDKNGDIVTIKPQRGNSKADTLAKLKKQRPDLFARVIAGEIVNGRKFTANAAAIEAGWRKKPTRLDTLRRIWSQATKEERDAFLAEITPPITFEALQEMLADRDCKQERIF